ncbi:hypothetical protein [Streptosporangium sp. V21-05]|uniref:hypothetical protein n=1 Tax=Streptosporangium sp. V21-05 TaxID=3446115 RepID=UPI003F538980
MGLLKRAIVGIVITGAAFSLTGTAYAGTASTSASTVALGSKFYGGYPDSGNCNYWRSAVKATGVNVSSCTYSTANKWHFTAWW